MNLQAYNSKPFAYVLPNGQVTTNGEAPDILPGVEPLFTEGYLNEQKRLFLEAFFCNISSQVAAAMYISKGKFLAETK